MIAQGWRPSMSNYVKINFNGAWKKDSHFAGGGCWPLAIKLALNRNFTDVILETDLKILMDGELRNLNRTAQDRNDWNQSRATRKLGCQTTSISCGSLLSDGLPYPPGRFS
ncbi:unnamed protein product [Prunus armeniaca]|uniref:Uncharacterized protein n=1 Tax=Prunus armeniaca TaxID=36596 RepID=A0A6J5XST7_PRUAR|nr:unnamed protein product [Prunus armeniaca]